MARVAMTSAPSRKKHKHHSAGVKEHTMEVDGLGPRSPIAAAGKTVCPFRLGSFILPGPEPTVLGEGEFVVWWSTANSCVRRG
jgi:hypothetical protein